MLRIGFICCLCRLDIIQSIVFVVLSVFHGCWFIGGSIGTFLVIFGLGVYWFPMVVSSLALCLFQIVTVVEQMTRTANSFPLLSQLWEARGDFKIHCLFIRRLLVPASFKAIVFGGVEFVFVFYQFCMLLSEKYCVYFVGLFASLQCLLWSAYVSSYGCPSCAMLSDYNVNRLVIYLHLTVQLDMFRLCRLHYCHRLMFFINFWKEGAKSSSAFDIQLFLKVSM